jgi:hypothetical protein
MNKDEAIVFLWNLLDDIDTASDMFKENYEEFAKYVYKKQRKRFETGIDTDGYNLSFPNDWAKEAEQ